MDITRLEKGEIDRLDYPMIVCRNKDDDEDNASMPVESVVEYDYGVQATVLAEDYQAVPDRFEGCSFELVTSEFAEFMPVEAVMAGDGRVLFEG